MQYGPENVSVQSGGKPVIGKFLMSVMEDGDEVRIEHLNSISDRLTHFLRL